MEAPGSGAGEDDWPPGFMSVNEAPPPEGPQNLAGEAQGHSGSHSATHVQGSRVATLPLLPSTELLFPAKSPLLPIRSTVPTSAASSAVVPPATWDAAYLLPQKAWCTVPGLGLQSITTVTSGRQEKPCMRLNSSSLSAISNYLVLPTTPSPALRTPKPTAPHSLCGLSNSTRPRTLMRFDCLKFSTDKLSFLAHFLADGHFRFNDRSVRYEVQLTLSPPFIPLFTLAGRAYPGPQIVLAGEMHLGHEPCIETIAGARSSEAALPPERAPLAISWTLPPQTHTTESTCFSITASNPLQNSLRHLPETPVLNFILPESLPPLLPEAQLSQPNTAFPIPNLSLTLTPSQNTNSASHSASETPPPRIFAAPDSPTTILSTLVAPSSSSLSDSPPGFPGPPKFTTTPATVIRRSARIRALQTSSPEPPGAQTQARPRRQPVQETETPPTITLERACHALLSAGVPLTELIMASLQQALAMDGALRGSPPGP